MDKIEQIPQKKSLLNTLIKVILPLALGVYIIYYLFKGVNFIQVWDIVKAANWPILLSSLVFGLLGNTLRGYRWELFVRPLGYSPKVSTLNYAIFGGYAVNYAIPRAGEIWKCGMIAKEEKVPFSKLLGTMILDRVFDTVTVLFIVLVAFIVNVDFFVTQLQHNKGLFDTIVAILQSPLLYILIVAAAITTYVVFRFFKENFIVRKVRGLIVAIYKDMKAIWKMKTKFRLLLYTIAIWTSYFFYFYITFFAFDFTKDLGFEAGLIAFALSSLSMGIPSNGGLGPWQVAVIAALTIYGVGQLEATAFATGVFAVQGIWVILCGLFGIVMLAVKKQK